MRKLKIDFEDKYYSFDALPSLGEILVMLANCNFSSEEIIAYLVLLIAAFEGWKAIPVDWLFKTFNLQRGLLDNLKEREILALTDKDDTLRATLYLPKTSLIIDKKLSLLSIFREQKTNKVISLLKYFVSGEKYLITSAQQLIPPEIVRIIQSKRFTDLRVRHKIQEFIFGLIKECKEGFPSNCKVDIRFKTIIPGRRDKSRTNRQFRKLLIESLRLANLFISRDSNIEAVWIKDNQSTPVATLEIFKY